MESCGTSNNDIAMTAITGDGRTDRRNARDDNSKNKHTKLLYV